MKWNVTLVTSSKQMEKEKEKEIQTLFKLYGMCLFLWRPKQDVHQAGVKRKSQRDGIRG